MYFLSFINNLLGYLPAFKISDIVEILLFIIIIYKVIENMKNTRAVVVLKGIFILFLFYVIAYVCSFDAIIVIFQSVISLLIFALVVVFQPEMRKFLEQIGTKNITEKFNLSQLFGKNKPVFKYYSDKSITELIKACFAMGEVKTGALIVIERDIPLNEYIETGIGLNADLTSQLLINIFEKNTPLHDGAVIQIKDKVVSATCYLPLSSNPKISKHMGTRHRAAIGISEVTDCLVIVVSEETGNVSLAVNGKITTNLTKEKFRELLYNYQIKENVVVKDVEPKTLKESFKKWWKGLIAKNTFNDKIVACVVGFVGWLLLINIANPVTTRTFENVPIEFINTSVIETTGMTYEVLSEKEVDVRVTDKRDIVDNLRKEDITVIADFSKLSYVNAVPLSGFVESSTSTTVDIIGGSTITIQLDTIISKEVPVVLETYVDENSTTYVPNLTSNVESVIISGGKSKVDTLDKVVCRYDVTNATGTYTGISELDIYDKNGDLLDNSDFEINVESVEATGSAYNIKEVPINVQLGSEYYSSYKVLGVVSDPATVRIVAEDSVLNSFNELTVDTNVNIDSTITNNEFIKMVDLMDYLPENVYLLDDSDISLTISFEPLNTKTIQFDSGLVYFVGLDSTLNASILDTNFSIIISGEEDVLDKISKDNIKPYIDVTGLTAGDYNLIMQFDGLDSVILMSNISVRLAITAN